MQIMNIKAVAKLAGVSTATVSRTINGTARISPKTEERVRRAIKSLNFYPDTNARALGSGRSSLYGLIISDITNPFYPELIKAFEDIAIAHNQEILVANTNYDPERMKICVTRMLQRKVDGVAIMTSEMDEGLIKDFSRRNIPLAFLDAGTPGPGVSSVHINYAAGIEAAMSHLIGLGHQRIAFITGPLRLASARARFRIFKKIQAREHLAAHPGLIEVGNHRVDGGREAMLRILDSTAGSDAMPTAVLGSNDLTAIGAMGAIHERKLAIPRDISVMGFDNIQLSAYTMPSLSTVSVPRAELAKAAFRALLHAQERGLAKLPEGQKYTIDTTLVLRNSTGPVRKPKATATRKT
jgi:DNA-binding LacI/PurR family transcriptional regulator